MKYIKQKGDGMTEKEKQELIKAQTADFLSRASSEAKKFFEGECVMNQKGFEICIHEMVRFGYVQLYSKFCEEHRENLEIFNRRVDEMEERGRKEPLPEQKKKELWEKIVKRLKETGRWKEEC